MIACSDRRFVSTECPRSVHERVKSGRQSTTPANSQFRGAPAQDAYFNIRQHRLNTMTRTCNHKVASSILAPGSSSEALFLRRV